MVEVLIHTGQHYDDNMSRIFFEELELREPDYNLGIGSASQGAQTGRMIEGIERILLEENPHWVLLYGDTNSTLAGAIAASKLNLPIAHVEAGLRSFNRKMPEEINRVLTDHVSELLFAPTEAAVTNLVKEGISGSNVVLSGDVMYDAVRVYGQRSGAAGILERLGLRPKGYVLATVHRAENTSENGRFAAIMSGLSELALTIPVVMPVHPRTRHCLSGSSELADGIILLEPVSYIEMTALTKGAAVVCTDSGGLQKEAYFHGVLCFTLRQETEWVELVELGCNRLMDPTVQATFSDQVREFLQLGFPETALAAKPYGDGNAGLKICEVLLAAKEGAR